MPSNRDLTLCHKFIILLCCTIDMYIHLQNIDLLGAGFSDSAYTSDGVCSHSSSDPFSQSGIILYCTILAAIKFDN